MREFPGPSPEEEGARVRRGPWMGVGGHVGARSIVRLSRDRIALQIMMPTSRPSECQVRQPAESAWP